MFRVITSYGSRVSMSQFDENEIDGAIADRLVALAAGALEFFSVYYQEDSEE